MSDPGDPHLPSLGADLDIRTDVPLYRVWRDGELVEECANLHHVWRDDLVSFAIGCSFSFDESLVANGIDVRHMSCGCNVPMYRTHIPTAAAGPFSGPMVVSMRPMKAADAIRAVQITSRFPACTVRRCTWAIPPRSASTTCSALTTATRSRSGPANCRCSGPAG